MTAPGVRTFLFESTSAVLWAEEVAGTAGIPVEVVPAPADSDAKCDLALLAHAARAEELAAAWTAAGVRFRPWPPGGPPPRPPA